MGWDDWQNWAAVAGVLGFVGFLAQWLSGARRSARNDLMVEIRSEIGREDLLGRYPTGRSDRYYRWLGGLLSWSARVYGPRWSLRSFDTCLTLACAYPLLAALIAWVATGATDVDSLTVFAEVDGALTRLGQAALFVIGILGTALILWAGITFDFRFGLRIQISVARLTTRTGLGKTVRRTSFVFAFAVAAAVSFEIAEFVAVVFGFSGELTIAFFCVLVFAGTFGAWIPIILASLFIVFLDGDIQTTQLLTFFFLLLPLANAFADYVSVSLTRWFLQDAYDRRYGGWRLLGWMLLDLIAGFAALALLLLGLVGLLELWALFTPPPLEWRAYWTAASADRSQGIALWVMCLTTLLPTLVHVAWALVLWLTDRPRPARDALRVIAHWDGAAPEADQAALALRAAKGLQAGQTVQILRFAMFFAALAASALWLEIFTLTSLLQPALDAAPGADN